MKLFQQLLVAGTALSLIAPFGAQASDYNIEGMNSYVRKKSSSKKAKQFNSNSFTNEIATNEEKVDSSESKFTAFEAGTFSDTTTLDSKAVLALGAIDGIGEIDASQNEALQFSYVYQMNLNTSFTGDDNLYVRLKTGTWADDWKVKGSTYHIETKDNADIFKLDKVWYTFDIGGITATYGPMIENYYMLAATPSIYKPGALKAFKLGGHSAAFGASTSQGMGLKKEWDNGMAASVTLNSKNADTADGMLTAEDENKINTMLAYTADNYHISATYSRQQHGWDAWTYFATADVAAHGNHAEMNADAVALRAWWRPENAGTATPSISLGYDNIKFENHNIAEDASGYMIGLNWQDMFQADDRIGFAYGQALKVDEAVAGVAKDEVDPSLWELYYSFKPNDNIQITPAIFAGSDVLSDTADDIFGAVVSTVFKF